MKHLITAIVEINTRKSKVVLDLSLAAIEKWIKHIYEIEEAPDVLQTELMKDRLIVKIKKYTKN